MDDISFEIDERMFAYGNFPKCPECNGPARPNVHMFADLNWVGARTAKQEKLYKNWLSEIDLQQLLIIEIGAGMIIKNVRLEAKRLGCPVVRINPDQYEVEKGAAIQLGALEALSELEKLT